MEIYYEKSKYINATFDEGSYMHFPYFGFLIFSSFISRYTAKNVQVATSLLKSCNNLLQQADIRMRSHGLLQLVTTSLLQVVKRLVTS